MADADAREAEAAILPAISAASTANTSTAGATKLMWTTEEELIVSTTGRPGALSRAGGGGLATLGRGAALLAAAASMAVGLRPRLQAALDSFGGPGKQLPFTLKEHYC